MEQVVKVSAPAKINLGLSVLRKRDDGYHEIRTLFQAVSLCDELELEPIPKGIELTLEGEGIPNDQENIAWKAAESFLSRLRVSAGVHIRLRKNIPVAAGLGGGSSDAAAVLKGLSRLFSFSLPRNELLEMGRHLGADVPFFLFGNSALGEGTGAILSSISALPQSWIVIINPGFPISTKWVYDHASLLLTKKPDHINMVKYFLRENDLPRIGYYLHNDLEAVVLKRYPIINELKNRLLSAGAVGAVMSGSGASVFGLFADRPLADQAFNRMRREGNGWKIFLTEPLSNTTIN
ncbi:MAG: 4-(cytidine 5'-diphospho)-2-C-methyl-D-erythritol kinase [bacterium]